MFSNLFMTRDSRLATVALFGTVVLLSSGCNGSSVTPTEPATAELSITSAQVLVGSSVVNGQTLPQGHGEGESTRFEAQLMANGARATGATVWMQFDRPRGMGMAHHVGRIPLYDDGTHGDRVAGDGLYCYQDDVGEYGCHGGDAEPGEYHYEFFGEHPDGHETNHMLVTVAITGSGGA
jgi:hypothetical protein